MLVVLLFHSQEYGINMQQCSSFIKLNQFMPSFSLTDTSMQLDKLLACRQQVRQFILLSILTMNPHFQGVFQEISSVMAIATSPKRTKRIPVQ